MVYLDYIVSNLHCPVHWHFRTYLTLTIKARCMDYIYTTITAPNNPVNVLCCHWKLELNCFHAQLASKAIHRLTYRLMSLYFPLSLSPTLSCCIISSAESLSFQFLALSTGSRATGSAAGPRNVATSFPQTRLVVTQRREADSPHDRPA